MSTAAEQKEKLAQKIETALREAVACGELPLDSVPKVELEIPRDKDHGDFASNIAMVLAKPAKMPPRSVAALIVKRLDDPMFERVEVAGPGFINFKLSREWLFDLLGRIHRQQEAYGDNDVGQGEKVLLEFVSANPVGPMNVVNARAAAIGDTLARLMRAAGYDVATEYYVNDAGKQADIFGRSLEARYRQLQGEEVVFPADGYPGKYVQALAEKLQNEEADIDAMDEQRRQEFFRQWGTDAMLEMQRRDLADYGVVFDRWFRESELHKQGSLEEIIELFKGRGYMYEDDGALWFRSTQFGDDKDRVIIKQDGSYTYVTADIAYHYDKLKRGHEKLIDILGPDHHGYIGRMKAAVEALGYGRDALEVMILQYVALLRDGQQVKMSKRAGEFITMQDLLDEVGRDAARFFFLMRSPESHLDFDLTLAAEQSNENPVFYIQYAHARICSMLRQAHDAGIPMPDSSAVALDALQHGEELDLIRKMAEFPEEVAAAAWYREPHRLARYGLDFAGLFHSFYTHCRVLGEEREVQDARLVLVGAVQIVLRRVLGLLGVGAPESM